MKGLTISSALLANHGVAGKLVRAPALPFTLVADVVKDIAQVIFAAARALGHAVGFGKTAPVQQSLAQRAVHVLKDHAKQIGYVAAGLSAVAALVVFRKPVWTGLATSASFVGRGLSYLNPMHLFAKA